MRMGCAKGKWRFNEYSFTSIRVIILGVMVLGVLDASEIERRVNAPKQASGSPLIVNLTLVRDAVEKGAVCLDGTPPGYHLDRGFGSGRNNWLVQFEGGGWCNNVRTCVFRKTTHHGSSQFMEKKLQFSGILSNNRSENPDFYNWNRVKLRYCDGASFTGDGQYEKEVGVPDLYFRGQKIWRVLIEDLLSKGMKNVKQALLSGCSAGGLSSILHCDEFRDLLPRTAKVKCLSDAGFFINTQDIAGSYVLRSYFEEVVTLQNASKNLPRACTSHWNATECFFPQYFLRFIKTPLFILNSAYDAWQVLFSLVPNSADPGGHWSSCKRNLALCTYSQLRKLQGFRNEMLYALQTIRESRAVGTFINSCLLHCHSETQDIWFADNSPRIENKTIAESVGDWYFDRRVEKLIDCPYPCDRTCPSMDPHGKHPPELPFDFLDYSF